MAADLTGPASAVAGTAYWIAAVRARESRRPDRLFDDPYAATLAGDRGPAVMAASERVSGENQFIPVRVRWFDDAVTAAVGDGVDQVVLLGAGLDTRAYRLPLPADLDWYEVDRAEIFATKGPVLAAAGAVPRCRRREVVADVTGDLLGPLGAAGWLPGRRTAWVAEGLVFYLDATDVEALLRATASAGAPGSRFMADIMGDAAMRRPVMEEYRRRQGVRGLPAPYGHDDPAALLGAAGWRVHTLTWAGAPDAHYDRLRTRRPGDVPAEPSGGPPARAYLVIGST